MSVLSKVRTLTQDSCPSATGTRPTIDAADSVVTVGELATPASAIATEDSNGKQVLWPDARLVRECLAGSEEAWCALIDKYKNLIFSVPIKYGFSQDAAADIFQAVCLDLVSELPRLREPRALPAWLFQVTSRTCFHWMRQQQRIVTDEDLDAQAAPGTDRPEVAERVLLEVEQEHVLRQALAGLPRRCRQLVEMLFFETPARPYREIARSLGIATGSIGFIRGRCLERLRRALEKMGFK